jgi:anti-sigma B factor antagonist
MDLSTGFGMLAREINCGHAAFRTAGPGKDTAAMEMQVTAISQLSARIVLTGRLDLAGSAKIDLPFNAAAGSNRNILVDMSGVTFVASIGIRTLVLGAKTVQRRGGRLLLINPQAEVEQVLEMTGVLDLLPVVRDEAQAMAAIDG